MPSASGPVTAVFDGHTFTSPTVYLSFDYLSTELDLPLTANTSLAAPGVILTNALVPIASTSVSTIYWNDTDFYTVSVDWSNLNAPVPYLAYNQGRVGWNGETSTSTVIYPDDFAPYISLPSTIVSLVPDWSRCSLNDVGVWDPPHALQPVADPAKPVDTFTSAKASTSITSPVPAPGPRVGSFEPTSTVTESPRLGPHPKSTAKSQQVDPSIVSLGIPPPQKSAAGSSPEIPAPNAGLVPFLSPSNGSPSKNGNGEAPAPAPAPTPSDDRSHVSETANNQGSRDGAAWAMPSVSGADPGVSLGSSLGADIYTTGISPGDIIVSFLGLSQNDGNSGSRTDPLVSDGKRPDTEVSGQMMSSNENQKLDSLNGKLGSTYSGSNFEDDSASDFAPQSLDSGADARSKPTNLVGSSADDVPQEARLTLSDGRVFTTSIVPDHPDLIAIGGQTLRVGGNAKTIDGDTFSAAPDGVVLISGSQTSTLPLFSQVASAALGAQGPAIFTGNDGSIVTAFADPQNQNFVVGGRTIVSDGPAITVAGNTVSAMSNGLVVLDGTYTRVLHFPSLPPEGIVFTAPYGNVITAYSALGGNGAMIINGQTLSQGGPAVTSNGQTMSAKSNELIVSDGSHTQTLHLSSSQKEQNVVTAPDGKVMTAYSAAASSGAIVIDGHTFSVGGPALTVDGESLSDGPNGLVMEDTMGKSTVAFQMRETTAANVPTTTGAETSNVATVSTPLPANGGGRNLASNITYAILLAAFAVAVSRP